MYPRELGTIPEETARVARAACPKGTLAMRLRDALAELYQDEQFVALYPVEGQPAYHLLQLMAEGGCKKRKKRGQSFSKEVLTKKKETSLCRMIPLDNGSCH